MMERGAISKRVALTSGSYPMCEMTANIRSDELSLQYQAHRAYVTLHKTPPTSHLPYTSSSSILPHRLVHFFASLIPLSLAVRYSIRICSTGYHKSSRRSFPVSATTSRSRENEDSSTKRETYALSSFPCSWLKVGFAIVTVCLHDLLNSSNDLPRLSFVSSYDYSVNQSITFLRSDGFDRLWSLQTIFSFFHSSYDMILIRFKCMQL